MHFLTDYLLPLALVVLGYLGIQVTTKTHWSLAWKIAFRVLAVLSILSVLMLEYFAGESVVDMIRKGMGNTFCRFYTVERCPAAIKSEIEQLRLRGEEEQKRRQAEAQQKAEQEVVARNTARPSVAPGIPAQAILREEQLGKPNGLNSDGSVTWSTELRSSGREGRIQADVKIPARNLTFSIAFQKNSDKSLPATHTLEIMTPGELRVTEVPGLLAKDLEYSRGTPIRGLGVKVTDGFFLLGLSQIPEDVTANRELLLERKWFDVPIKYSDGRRAILTIEKGLAGDRFFKEASAKGVF